MKKWSKISVLLASMAIVMVALGGCTVTDKNYFKNVSSYSFWKNKGSESIAQYQYYNVMKDFLEDGVLQDGNVKKDGKVKKVAFIGWDGARAESLINILHDENNFDNNNYVDTAEYSGLNELRKTGGVYMSYCGGEKGKDSEQDTSTSTSWTSEFTGVWAKEHGVIDNNAQKNIANKTILLEYALRGLQTSLAFDWGNYFDYALSDEVKFLIEYNKTHEKLNITYKDIDRKIASSIDEAKAFENIKGKNTIMAQNLEMHNFVASDSISKSTPYDSAMRDYIINRIGLGDDIVAGIFHNPDTNGHTKGFSNSNPSYVNSVRNSDAYLYEIIQTLLEREKANNEEWLIIVGNDHGGSGKGHGKQIYEHRTNWVASNKVIDTKYYGTNYDGFKEN